MTEKMHWTPRVVDDPEPPKPDDILLARVVRRGRQRQIRGRMISAGTAVSLAFFMVAGGIAIAQHSDAPTDIAVTSPTPATPHTRIVERTADTNGLHYTLRLLTPEVAISEKVIVSLQVDNRTGAATPVTSCDLTIIAISGPDSTRMDRNKPCSPSRFDLPPGDSYSWVPEAIAPNTPGDYSVLIRPRPALRLPAALLQPLSLRVLDTPSSTRTT